MQASTKLVSALISVSDKTGIVEFAKFLAQLGVSIVSTGGTAQLLRDAQVSVTEVATYTGFPEMLGGRVKTLHPKIHGGILGCPDVPEHRDQMDAAGIPSLNLVIVNLYPFKETIAKPDCTLADAIENIDIGGPALIRSAAKNFVHATVVTNPGDYAELTRELELNNGTVCYATRFALAKKAFTHTANYDLAISQYLNGNIVEPDLFPENLALHFKKVHVLRYGENPHQAAAFYSDLVPPPGSLAHYRALQGKALSYNNIADANAAWECVKAFEQPACVIVKHANPCGVAIAQSIALAYQKALATDPTSAFGGIVAFNRNLDSDTAEQVIKLFLEVLIAPGYDEAAKKILAQKPNLRVLEIPLGEGHNALDLLRVGGGLLVQTPDIESNPSLQVVTETTPNQAQHDDLLFAWKVAKFVKSNAIVFAAAGQTLGIGAGQMSRIDSTKIAVLKAAEAGLNLKGSVAASDAFFPFRDGLDVIAKAGATAIIQPGGSLRDQEVIDAANAQHVAMIFTGVRHFRHA